MIRRYKVVKDSLSHWINQRNVSFVTLDRGRLSVVVYVKFSGRGAARLARYSGGVEVVGSNPVAPTMIFTPDTSDCLC
jgi:hypothetical protein